MDDLVDPSYQSGAKGLLIELLGVVKVQELKKPEMAAVARSLYLYPLHRVVASYLPKVVH